MNGYVPISSYAALGDGRTVALVAGDGRVDWWPLPTLDAPPAFAAVVDADAGGHISFGPDGPCTVHRRYLPDSNVLESTVETAAGTARVLDALAVGRSGRLPWTHLIRKVEGVAGSVRMCWRVAPGSRFGTARPWTEVRRGHVLLHLGDQHLCVEPFDVGDPEVGPHDVSGEFATEAGSHHLLSVTASDRAPVFVADRQTADDHLSLTHERWQEWAQSIGYDGPWREAVRRSAMALKLLLFSPTGAIAAAATTSLPERIGGERNYDYRYMWVRDASFAADALIGLRLDEEVQAAVNWLLGTVRHTCPDVHVFYKLDGSVPPSEQRSLEASGYRGSTPVRSGNSASDQTQLGAFGDLFDTVWRFVQAGHLLDPDTGRMLAALADRCCDLWLSPDAGIWELHDQRHYTISKMGCWVALDRAVRLAEAGEIATGHVQRWEAERDEIRRWVQEHCWSEDKRSYTFYAGTDDLDAATLLAGSTGFDTGERLLGTVDAVRRELARGPLVYRYSDAVGKEGAFLACTFWLVSALVAGGRPDEAERLMDEAVGLVNDVGLLSEEMDVESGELRGNVPQALSHLALVNAAVAVSRSRS